MTDWQTLQPKWGLVLGSGLGGFAEQLQQEAIVPYAELEGLPVARVPGHAGQFVFGSLGTTPVVVAQGRVHLYEGWSAREVTAAVRWMAERGVRHLVLTNAAGSLNPDFPPGSWMMLRDHLNLTGTSPLSGSPHFVDLTEVYSRNLRERFAKAATATGCVLLQGVYAGLRGPEYETPAEVKMLRTLGADAAGMSTVLEAIHAHALGIEVVAFSCLTNWGAGLSDTPVTHAEVLSAGARASTDLARLLIQGITAETEPQANEPHAKAQSRKGR